jgi:hypothetical protein
MIYAGRAETLTFGAYGFVLRHPREACAEKASGKRVTVHDVLPQAGESAASIPSLEIFRTFAQ